MTDPKLVLGRLRGYRIWHVVDLGDGEPELALKSAGWATVWPWTPAYRATCRRAAMMTGLGKLSYQTAHGPVPDKRCQCGIYARLNPYDLREYKAEGDATVFGVIEAWGRIEIGVDRRAFRAELARIVALQVRPLYRALLPEHFEVVDIRSLKPGEGFEVSFTGIDAWHSVPVEFEELPELRAHIGRLLGERYRVPVYDTPQALVSDFPPINVGELLGAERKTDERA